LTGEAYQMQNGPDPDSDKAGCSKGEKDKRTEEAELSEERRRNKGTEEDRRGEIRGKRHGSRNERGGKMKLADGGTRTMIVAR